MIAALLLALAPQTADAEEPAPVLAERAPVAGMQALMSVSTLIYEGYPERPHELLAIYVFPDRALWRRSLVGGSAHDRQIEYRSGDTCWRMDPAESSSRRLDPRGRDEQALRMELRRALLLWPDGFGWETVSGVAHAELRALGRLEAPLGDDGLPARLTSFDSGDRRAEVFDEIVWSRETDRALPSSARLAVDGDTVWRETFTQIATQARFLDHLFVPPDRRGDLPALYRTGLAPLSLELPARAVLRTPLDPELGWPGALERARDLRLEIRRTLAPGRGLARGLEIELSPGGRPRSVLLALAAPEPLPRGWKAAPPEQALAVNLETFPAREAGGLAALLEGLRREVPRPRGSGSARVWLDPDGDGAGRSLRVLLPLTP